VTTGCIFDIALDSRFDHRHCIIDALKMEQGKGLDGKDIRVRGVCPQDDITLLDAFFVLLGIKVFLERATNWMCTSRDFISNDTLLSPSNVMVLGEGGGAVFTPWMQKMTDVSFEFP
jgi:hypothetical protein